MNEKEQAQRAEWGAVIWDLRQAAIHTSIPELLDRARIGMLEMLDRLNALTAERDALREQLQQAQDAAKRQAAYISACVDSDGCYRP